MITYTLSIPTTLKNEDPDIRDMYELLRRGCAGHHP
jgi:hypothetical protein